MVAMQVSCVKYVFRDHILFQFICVNTIQEQVLENVSVQMEIIGSTVSGLRNENATVLPKLAAGMLGYAYVWFERKKVGIPNLK